MDISGKGFSEPSRYTLEIAHSRIQPDVLNFHGREALSEPYTWRIEFTTPQSDLAADDLLLRYGSLSMLSGRVIYGVITRFEWLGTSADQTRYAVTLASRLALLSLTRRCAVYQNLSVPELVEQILRAHGLEGPDFDFRLECAYPQRELITQWRETDLEFIQRILSEVGIWFRTEMNAVTQLETLIIGDSQLNCVFDISMPYQEPSGLYDGAQDAVWDVRCWHNTVTGVVRTRDYNYRTAETPMDSAVTVRSDATTIGEHYRYGAPFLEAGDDAISAPETESGAFYARLHHERELNKATRLHLFSNASHLAPGQVLETPESPVTALKEGMLITLATYRAARDTRLHVSLWGIPYSERVNYRPAEIVRPEIHGTLPARIESREPHDIYAHLDGAGRYRVKLDFSREDADPGYHYLWVRQAKPYAGDIFGWHTPLLDGTDVSIAYDDGNIDRPYIAHTFHDAKHADIVTRDNRSQNILRTAAHNELRLEDLRGQEHIALSTPYGATSLNQGHITDEQSQQRGAGFELRTDEYGVIRVAKGLFITADGQTKAAGEVLERAAALREIEICLNQIQQLADAAAQAQALEADIASQIAMFDERLKPLNQMVHFHGPEGVAFTSGEHLQMTASQNVAMNAGGSLSMGAMGNMTLNAGEKIGLFARTGKLNVISGEGPVQFQAQNGAMSLSAQRKISLVSTSDMLFAGKKKVTLIGGGSYLKIEHGKIEYGTTATYLRKVERTFVAGSASQPLTFPEIHPVIQSTICIPCLLKAIQANDAIIEGL
ncbi:type VI secretion system Vgr family protein [Cronobacter turicensis]|uniref:type VI secretion system Vgr family protein n=1 Tax=Cronobacter turicensis TaxID=413502 RepID=UPI0024C335B6|nr:type VI secretion system tip protein VgrG [Cronobacter turicensis]MDK1184247.1 type VI secretion system tip protein VgrG [Cronobacter turicensis]MDK1206368.1 type VI secretion system tip protein VgrG [Cronobacter turicensis]MDK1213561.1 type VI secretion system tip protein VgrG [Cronobacter turicensis]MDK1218286.1 type VI secretion system tip protein VgrG [Cronobacter turicensis]MDK1229994.1 type VI secretion system tip protein VgrG [Cronobacter turicensis]